MTQHIFISHSTKNDKAVKRLREILELEGFTTWVDSREVSGGDMLDDTLKEKIKTAKIFMILLSIEALSSEWVQKELKLAQKIAKEHKDDGYKVISLIMPGVPAGLLKAFFPKEPIHIFLEEGTRGPDLDEKMPDIFAALGKELPNDWKPAEIIPFGDLSLSPAASCLHYGQEIFEGMKAYGTEDDKIQLFRPKNNFERLNASAERMCMATIDVDYVMEGLKELLRIEKRWIPVHQSAV